MTIKQRYEGIQSLLGKCYDGGCHFLTLLTIIENHNQSPVDLIDAARVAQSKGWFDQYFEGKDALAFLKYYTDKEWTRRTVHKLPEEIKSNEYIEVVWFNPRTGFHHFRPYDYDVLNNSVTVREGYVEKYYIYTVEV